MTETIDVAERIRQVRAIEAKIDGMEEEFEAKLKPLKDFAEQARASLLQYLNQTNQRSAQTEHGGISKKSKVSYRVLDKDSFKRHVIGDEAWQLIEWRAASSECELFTVEHSEPPPGLHRDARLVLSVTAPTKPRKRKSNGAAEAVAGEAGTMEQEEVGNPEGNTQGSEEGTEQYGD